MSTVSPPADDEAMVAAPRRVTVAGPAARVDISLPPQATIAELVPQLVRMATTAKQQSANGWTIGRLGASPLDAQSTVASAGIRDGEVLYLFGRESQPQPLLFDDVAEAVADTVERDPGRWGQGYTRVAGLVTGGVAFAALTVLLAFTWPVTASGFAFFLLLLGTYLSRTTQDVPAALTPALAGLPGFALAVAQLVVLPGAGWGAAHATAGAAAALLYSLTAAAIVAGGRIWFAGPILGSGAGCLVAVAVLTTGLPSASIAAGVLAVALIAAATLPGLALRLARVPLPRPPVDATALRMDQSPPAGAELTTMTEAATHTLASLLGGLVALIAGCALVLLNQAPPWSLALVVLSGMALLLRARAYVQAGQKLMLLTGGGVMLIAAAASLPRAAVFVAALVAATAAFTRGVRSWVPASPYWSRLLDVIEFVVLISLVPVALAVLDAYSMARNL